MIYDIESKDCLCWKRTKETRDNYSKFSYILKRNTKFFIASSGHQVFSSLIDETEHSETILQVDWSHQIQLPRIKIKHDDTNQSIMNRPVLDTFCDSEAFLNFKVPTSFTLAIVIIDRRKNSSQNALWNTRGVNFKELKIYYKQFLGGALIKYLDYWRGSTCESM